MWIEICIVKCVQLYRLVTLYTRVWIEISCQCYTGLVKNVTLYTRVWIEISALYAHGSGGWSPSTRGCGLKSIQPIVAFNALAVTLYTRVWIEIIIIFIQITSRYSHPLHEGVD